MEREQSEYWSMEMMEWLSGGVTKSEQDSLLASTDASALLASIMTARAFALFLGLLTTINLAGDLFQRGFDANSWWIHFSLLPAWLSKGVLAFAAVALLGFAFRPPRVAHTAWVTAGLVTLLAATALGNAGTFYWLLATGRISAGFPVPLSLTIAVGLLLVAHASVVGTRKAKSGSLRVLTGGLCLLGAFPLALMLYFGNTDYRRPADAVVVFGARAHADGRLSDALEDRIRTACEIHQSGLAKRLVLSGGPGDGAVHETEAMRRYAVEHGVDPEDIFEDRLGWNTAATVANTVPLFRKWKAERVLVVSHFYHLPRIKLAYQRAGMEVCTIPARQGHLLGQLPYNMAREVAAFWVYYLKQTPAEQPVQKAA